MNLLSFKLISIATAALMLMSALMMGFAPKYVFLLFALEGNDIIGLFMRSVAILFFGLAVLSWTGRNAVHSQLRQTICIGMMVIMGGLAVLGFGEFARGFAGIGILGAAITEALFAMGYIKIWQKNAADQGF